MATVVQNIRTWNTTAAPPAKTAVITPAVNGLLVVVSGSSGIITDPTITDDKGGTYTKILIAVRSSSGSAVWLHVRDTVVAAAVAHTVSYTPGATDTGGGLYVIEISGIEKSGAAAVVQSGKQENQASGGTAAPTLPANANTNNVVIVCQNQLANAATTSPTGFLENGMDTGYGTPNNSLEVATVNSGFTGPTATYGLASAGGFCSFIAEFEAAVPASVELLVTANPFSAGAGM